MHKRRPPLGRCRYSRRMARYFCQNSGSVDSFQVLVRCSRILQRCRNCRSHSMLMLGTMCCSIKYSRSLGSDHCVMPMSALGEDNATSPICSRRSAVNFRGVSRTCQYGYQEMPSMPWSLKRWMTIRAHCGEQSTRSPMSRLPKPPRDSKTMRACKRLTALQCWRFMRSNFFFSCGRRGRTITLFMGVSAWAGPNDPPCGDSYSHLFRAAAQHLNTIAVAPHETCQLETALGLIATQIVPRKAELFACGSTWRTSCCKKSHRATVKD